MKGSLEITKEELETILTLHFDCDRSSIKHIEFKDHAQEYKKQSIQSKGSLKIGFDLS